MICNADFDGTNGYDKAGCGARGRLTRYVPEPEASVPETVPPPEPTPWQKAHTCFKNNQII